MINFCNVYRKNEATNQIPDKNALYKTRVQLELGDIITSYNNKSMRVTSLLSTVYRIRLRVISKL